MPQHEFFCNSCQQPFSKELTAEEYEEGNVICPYCEGEDVQFRKIA